MFVTMQVQESAWRDGEICGNFKIFNPKLEPICPFFNLQ